MSEGKGRTKEEIIRAYEGEIDRLKKELAKEVEIRNNDYHRLNGKNSGLAQAIELILDKIQ